MKKVFLVSAILGLVSGLAFAEVTYEKVDDSTVKRIDTEAGVTLMTRAEVLECLDSALRDRQRIRVRKVKRIDKINKSFNELLSPLNDKILECQDAIEAMDQLEIANSYVVVPLPEEENMQTAEGY